MNLKLYRVPEWLLAFLLITICFLSFICTSCSKEKGETIQTIHIGSGEDGPYIMHGGSLSVRIDSRGTHLRIGQKIVFDESFRRSGKTFRFGDNVVTSDGNDAYYNGKIVTAVEVSGKGLKPITEGWLQKFWKHTTALFHSSPKTAERHKKAPEAVETSIKKMPIFKPPRPNKPLKKQDTEITEPTKSDLKNTKALYNRGFLYASKGDLKSALTDYNTAIELKDDADAYYNRAVIYVRNGKFKEAIKDFTETINLEPENADAYCNRGNVYSEINKITLAIKDYNAALKIDPNDGIVYYNRARAYFAIHDRNKVIADLKNSAKYARKPKGDEGANVQRNLSVEEHGGPYVFSPTASTQEIVKEKPYQLRLQPEWTRTKNLPQGIDVGFRKKTAGGDYATFYFHHEVMPPEEGAPPSNTSDMKRQADAMVRNKYPDARSVEGSVPKVSGRVLINGEYELTDDGKKVRRRYTYFFAGKTAFVVQCSAVPRQWASVLIDFDTMLASLQPGGSTAEKETKSDNEAKAELKRNLPTLLDSFPSQWRCSLSDVTITPSFSKDKRALVIALSFARTNIAEIYNATKTVFGMVKAGGSDSDLNSLSPETQMAARSSSEFIKYVGQVWGLAWSYVANCSPAIERYKLPILNSKGQRIGSISISREDGSTILTGKVTAADAQRVASMYVFE